ncbi:hypothetical protein KEM14_gp57 [Xanthomonas virus phiXaf18]|uniref:Uncharacterized protein n=1 Tax=Xanthomonas virus phiXaf18 TaxID=2653651 RepID=A0A5P8PQK2_9CAUD|nr:hypothetical protein KEM14_gp57 [Xanthomonas virus phiXaf18]QFR59554.1 hypothetical protein phiXaf18_57 [Xanthomonas virus phiXaf18]
MTSPNRRLSLEDVLDALFLRDDAPTPEMIVQACQAHAEFREEILEFAALQAAQAALPDVAESDLEVSDASVMRLRSHVLNLLYGAAHPRRCRRRPPGGAFVGRAAPPGGGPGD